MAPKSSSASAATRKKHAKKSQLHSAQPTAEETPSTQLKQKKDKKAPKVKRFVPPPTYQGESDPVDILKLGLHGSPVKPERAVILRKLGKKDPTTVERGLDEWISWITATFDPVSTNPDHAQRDPDDCDELVATVPVWIHHFPRLVVHPSRRVRALVLTLFEWLVGFHRGQDFPCRSLMLNPVELERPEYIGSWFISLWDPDKSARAIAAKVWNELVDLNSEEQTQVPNKFKLLQYDSEILQHLFSLIQPSEVDNSQHPESSGLPRKVAVLSESEESTSCRLRASAFEALAHLLQIHPEPRNSFDSIVNSPVGHSTTWNLILTSNNQESLVRKAMWVLLQALSVQQPCKPLLDSLLPVFSFSVLRAAFTERDWGVQGTMITGLITLLKSYPALWWATSPSTRSQPTNSDRNEVTDEPSSQSVIMDTFYEFLELGCSGNPTFLYPALILIIQSFPITIGNVESFFRHFWVPHDTRTLRSSGMKGLVEFFRSWSECLLFFEKKQAEQADVLYRHQFIKMWTLIGHPSNQLDAGFEALSSALIKVISQSAFAPEYAWPVIETTIREEHDPGKVLLYLRFLSQARISHPEDALGMKAKDASLSLSHRALNCLNGVSDSENQTMWIPVLTHILEEESAGRQLLDESSLAVLLEFIRASLHKALWLGSKPHYNLFLNILQTSVKTVSRTAWLTLTSLNDFDSEFVAKNQRVISGIFSRVTKSNSCIQLPNLGIDHFVMKCYQQLLQSNSTARALIELILMHPELFIQDQTRVDLVGINSHTLHEQINSLSHNLSSFAPTQLGIVLPMCYLQLQHLDNITSTLRASLSKTLDQLVVDLLAAELFLQLLVDESVAELVSVAHDASALALQHYPSSQLKGLYHSILQLICNCLIDVECPIHPFDLAKLLKLFLEQYSNLETQDFLSLLPIGNIGNDVLISLFTPKKFTPLLAVVDSLIQSTSTREDQVSINLNSKYDRTVLAILYLFVQDRKLVQTHLWLWSHCMYVGELARYANFSTTSVVETDNMPCQEELLAIVSAVDTSTTYFISSLSTNVSSSWHSDMIMKLDRPEDYLPTETDPLKSLILSLAIGSRGETIRNLAVVALHRVLFLFFKYSDTDAADLEKWLTFLQKIQSSHSCLCSPLIQSLKSYLFGNVNFQKYQNRLASKLTDVPSSKANVEGLQLMELLCATAPPSNSLHIFLPQQRVIFLLQTISGWLKSDDELENALNNKMLELFSILAPIIQTVMGTHWEQMMDLITINLEEASWEDEESLLLVWRSCLLIKTVLNILTHNHTLQTEIGLQVQDCIKLLLKLFCSAPFRFTMPLTSVTLLHTMEDVLREEQAHPFYSQAPIHLLANSVYSPSISTGVLGLTIAQRAVKHLVDNLVIDYELNSENSTLPSLPEEILNAVRLSDHGSSTRTLMSWILIFSYFQNASLRLKNHYSSQLRDANVVSDNLIPLLHQVLHVAERGKPIDISIWDIPSFDFSLLEDDQLQPAPLAAYVYFLALRTVPAQIRSWWEECRNKQLSMSVGGMISRNFSPLLINQELDKLKDPEVLKSLIDENLLIKVSPVIKEVKLTYTVDEESMEIVIRIPSDYPLQSVEVLDIRKVGIPDTTWRAWLFVVQQSITHHNGSIADAVVLFKKNISLHFEGVEACAICYAIISVVDRSLPSKACRTCRNRFHPSCLYKWFSTSHGSSCPLCRSLF